MRAHCVRSCTSESSAEEQDTIKKDNFKDTVANYKEQTVALNIRLENHIVRGERCKKIWQDQRQKTVDLEEDFKNHKIELNRLREQLLKTAEERKPGAIKNTSRQTPFKRGNKKKFHGQQRKKYYKNRNGCKIPPGTSGQLYKKSSIRDAKRTSGNGWPGRNRSLVSEPQGSTHGRNTADKINVSSTSGRSGDCTQVRPEQNHDYQVRVVPEPQRGRSCQ